MTFKTGDVGENWVQLWASQAGITPNQVRRDEFGWDFCFQFRRDPSDSVGPALDLTPPELTCWVQVKTTAVGASSDSVKLSNWQRMIKDPFPWFFLRIELDGEGEASRAFLVHVGEPWIERVLKRLRELEQSEADELHMKTLDLAWTDEEALATPFSRSLRERIYSAVGNLDDYVVRKAAFRNRVGYDDRFRQEVQITTPLGKTEADVALAVDFALGLEKRLPISAFVVSDVRFNVPRVIHDRSDLDGG